MNFGQVPEPITEAISARKMLQCSDDNTTTIGGSGPKTIRRKHLITFANVSYLWWSLDSITMRRLIHALPALAIMTVAVRLLQLRTGVA